MSANFLHKIIFFLIVSISFSVIAGKSGTPIGTGDNSFNQIKCPDILLTDIACGGKHVVGITTQGTLVAWGNNRFGQTNCPAGTEYTEVVAGDRHSVAINHSKPVAW